MSVLTDLIYSGANAVLELTKAGVANKIAECGDLASVAMPNTAYFLPTIYAATGVKVRNLSDLTAVLGVMGSLITNKDDLGEALNAGLATAVGAEVLEALKYTDSDNPYENETGIGFVGDPTIRALGVPLVTGDIPGVAVVLGESENREELCAIVKDYQNKGILTFLIGNVIEQCIEGGVKLGLEYRVVPLGHDVTSVIHVVTVAIRAALIFGNVEAGNLAELLKYTKERVPAFVNTFGALNEVVVAAGAGAIALGFPVIADVDLADNQVAGALESECDHEKTVERSLALRGIKIKSKELPIPVGFAAAFEGEVVRRANMHAEFNGEKTPTFELLLMKGENDVTDHSIKLVGPDIDGEAPVNMAIGVLVEVYGAKMQKDFESVLERKFHTWLNYMDGVMHTGQRNILRIRITKDAYSAGLRLNHFGEVIYHMIMDEFESVVDKCQITIYTDEAEVIRLRDNLAIPTYDERDERIATMTDESVDTFYTCILCQSFAPSHCCVVTPERLGLCGAVSWLDAKATKELQPTGPCQPIEKLGLIDEKNGQYKEVDRIVAEMTHGALEHVSLYSILVDPMTSCGCFECICGIMPEAKGVIIANREYGGITPLGMSFGELASLTGGGVQTPGFMGHGKNFIPSKKFMSAEGGLSRIVWMPKELKESVRDKLNASAKELYGIDNFTDMICDETISTDSEGVLRFLTEVRHPALNMAELM